MTLPNSSTMKSEGQLRIRKQHDNNKKKKSAMLNPELTALLFLALLASILFSIHNTRKLTNYHDKTHQEKKLANPHAPAFRVDISKPLQHEREYFLPTLKSCLPQTNPKKCKTFILGEEEENKKPKEQQQHLRERIALIAPPGELTQTFFHLIQSVINKESAVSGIEKFELIQTTHIAPYGYGKTHGYTRIIRVVPYPLLVGVTSTLQSALESGQSHLDIQMEEIKAGLRQQIRYHCRLSHIAAHTALWTVTLEDLTKATLKELIHDIRSFLGMQENSNDNNSGIGSDVIPPSGMGGMFHPIFSYGSDMLTSVQSMTPGIGEEGGSSGSNSGIGSVRGVNDNNNNDNSNNNRDLLAELDAVLLDEMRISKNLTAWPCESFWTVGERTKTSNANGNKNNDENGLKLSPIISKISKAMSPDCDNPLISCWVKRDLCESKGEGLCPK